MYLLKLAYKILGWYRLKTKDNFGFLGVGEIEEQLGAVWEVLQPSGRWGLYLPRKEYQYFAWGDTMACVTYSLMNCIETVLNRKYNEQWDFSDRFTAKMSGTTRQGNTMSRVINSMSINDGFVSFPFWRNEAVNFDEFYKEVTPEVKELAKKNLESLNISVQFIQGITKESIKEALTYSPLWVAIYAYGPKVDGVYQNVVGMNSNHCVMLYGIDADGNYQIYDHYNGAEYRLLASDYRIVAAAKVAVTKKTN